MKKLILILFTFLSLALRLTAQVEFIKRDELRKVCLYGVTHITDKQDNTYLLGTQGEFINDNYMYFDGSGQSVYTLYKIAPSGEILWRSNFDYNVSYARQILDRDSLIFLPFTVSGSRLAKRDIEGSAQIPYGAFIRKNDGALVGKDALCYYCEINKAGFPYYTDSPDVSFLKAVKHKDNRISCVQTINNRYDVKLNGHSYVMHAINTFESIDITDTLGLTNKITGPTGKDITMYDNIVHDEADDIYIITDSAGLMLYNRDWKFDRRISPPGIDTLHHLNYKISYNHKYYVVNYGTGVDYDMQPHFTSVITKAGKIISTKESPPYEVSGINEHNIIYAVVKPDNSDTSEHPVHLISMNIKQKHKKEQHFGPAYTRVNSLSFTNSNELILTGSSMTTISQKLPKNPAGIFYYKEPLGR